ncbi:MAG: phage portal protein BeeE, partial [Celeribacter sp.]|jgi:phage portal protein BeeE
MVFDFMKRGAGAQPEVKASATGPAIAYSSAGRVAWSPRDTTTLTRVGFTGNPVGFRSVKLIAEAASALPMVLQNRDARFDEHPLLSVISRPNPVQGRADLFEALYAQILLSGNGYLEAVGDWGQVPVELHVLRSDRMGLVPGADGWPVAYEYAVGNRKHRFDVIDGHSPVCHIKSFHPADDHYGLSPIQAAATAIDVHNSASRWSKGLLDNAARPSGAIVYGGSDGQSSMSSDQYDRLLTEMESHHQGARNAGRPMLLGIPGDATYGNYQEANRAFYRLTVLPLVQKVTGSIGHWLSELDLSRICSAPLTWYFASKEKRNGITTTNPRIPRRSGSHSFN